MVTLEERLFDAIVERNRLKDIIDEARKELEMVSPVSSKVRPLFEHVENALEILRTIHSN
jgi:tRNA-dihydrouridine synthase